MARVLFASKASFSHIDKLVQGPHVFIVTLLDPQATLTLYLSVAAWPVRICLRCYGGRQVLGAQDLTDGKLAKSYSVLHPAVAS